MSNSENWVDMRGICKRFGGVVALDKVSLQVKKGEIHALMGENGAGKSTIMKILAGSLEKDEGEIYIGGKPASIKSPKDGMAHGISIIYQELMLVNDLTVAENIFIDSLNRDSRIINWKKLCKKAQEYLDETGFSDIKATDDVGELTVAYQQVVEICKALSRNASVLILDEPTSVLSNNEVVHLFRLLRKLREEGVAIIYISHRLEEVMELCDRITIMRDGTYIDTVDTHSITKQELANKMVGRELQDYYPKRESHIGPVNFKVEDICVKGKVKHVSFEVRQGEVLGINGLVGAGRTETIRAIFGEDKRDSGKIYLNGKEVAIRNPRDAIHRGIGLLPEDRKTQGVLLDLPIRNNITLGCLKLFQTAFGKLSRKKETEYINDMVEQLSIKVGSIENDVSSLSGGNQQKVAIAKLLASDCKVLLLDEPTRGVDVGAKREIYKIINDFASRNYSIVMISSEMQEIMGMCDRVIIMRGGEVTGELDKKDFSESNLISYSMGV
jgi:ribose transport system ATP-binding protein